MYAGQRARRLTQCWNFLVTPIHCAVIYLLPTSGWAESERAFVRLFQLFSYLPTCGRYLRGEADDVRHVDTFAISKLALLAAVQFLLNTAEGAAPVSDVASIQLEIIRARMFIWPPCSLISFYITSVLLHFLNGFACIMYSRFWRSIEWLKVADFRWECSDKHFPYDLAESAVRGCPTGRFPPV